MASVNKVILVGHLGKDPEVRSFANGGRVASFSLATSESWRDKTTGERKERTEWHNVQIQNDALVDVAQKYLRKGGKAYVEGQLRTRKWQDRDGTDRYTTEVVIGAFHGALVLLDRAEGGNRPPPPGPDDWDAAVRPGPPRGADNLGALTSPPNPDDPLDDDVPF